jgi:magnesium chelatase subunit H
MEGGRQIDVAREILTAKNIPYFVSAPLLIQDVKSWSESGVQGLQQVVLFSLPELDGAIETTVLGGLVNGDQILVLPDRVRKLIQRVKAWVHLRKTPAAEVIL